MKTITNKLKKKGFALISVISVVVLMALVAVALLTLAVLNARGQGLAKDREEARDNAKLALIQAIGELQLLTGADTRITASSNIISAGQYEFIGEDENPGGFTEEDVPKVVAVWRSHEGTYHNRDTGEPVTPDYDTIKSANADPKEIVETDPNGGRFLGYITSQKRNQDGIGDLRGVSNEIDVDGDYINLLGIGSAVDEEDHVYVAPTILEGNGAFAYAVFGNNQKATLQSQLVDEDSLTGDDALAYWHERQFSSTRANAEAAGYIKLDDPSETFAGFSIPSVSTLDLIEETAVERKFNDYTVFGRGILTNTATGGWRKCLNLFSEQYEILPIGAVGEGNGAFPTFNLGPDLDPIYSSKAGNSTQEFRDNPLLYPWHDYINQEHGSSAFEWQEASSVGSWSLLVDHLTQYKSNSADGSVTMATINSSGFAAGGVDQAGLDQWHNKVRRLPVVARVQYVLSMHNVEVNVRGATRYQPSLLVSPAITLWNPYSTRLQLGNNYALESRTPLPARFGFTVNGGRLPGFPSLLEIIKDKKASGNNGLGQFYMNLITEGIVLEPGESLVFGANQENAVTNSQALQLTAGFKEQNGFVYTNIKRESRNANKNMGIAGNFTAGTDFTIHAMDFRADNFARVEDVRDDGETGYWMTFRAMEEGDETVSNTDVQLNPYRLRLAAEDVGGDMLNYISKVFPTYRSSEWTAELGDEELAEGLPFLLVNLELRGVAAGFGKSSSPSDIATDIDVDQLVSLGTAGLITANPLLIYSEAGSDSTEVFQDGAEDTGVNSLLNAPYVMSITALDGFWIGSSLPQSDPDTNNAFLITGSGSDAPTRAIYSEITTRPLQSLGQLQHFDVKKKTPVPPYRMNAIANSKAYPHFAPDTVSTGATFSPNSAAHLANDDSYILNNILFDDWFFSSIAPDLEPFSSEVDRDTEAVLRDFISRDELLPNPAYKLANHVDISNPSALAREIITDGGEEDVDAGIGFRYENVASMITVEGMFNVNSVSVDAWKAFLKGARDTPSLYFASGNTVDISEKSGNAETPFNRTSIVAKNKGEGASPEEIYTLTDEQIDALAEQMVDIIKERGPFLSLAEFVNRQLVTADPDLGTTERALAGVIQSALDRLDTEDPDDDASTDPYGDIKSLVDGYERVTFEELAEIPGATDHYKFPEAAEGSPIFGVPGWVTQADILTPIAPVLSARDDTFTIRSYGDKRDAAGNIVAKAWCEAVVQRSAEFVNSSDRLETRLNSLSSDVNRLMGRKYKIISFKWLTEDEL